MVTGDWRRLHNEELYDLYSSLNLIWMIKSRIMRWVGYWGGKESHIQGRDGEM
jgi:hypothetical protein